MDVACCVKIPKDKDHVIPDGILYSFFSNWYAPALLTDWVRTIVVSILCLIVEFKLNFK